MLKAVTRLLIANTLLLAAACGGPSGPTATIAGQWSGTTSQGTPITFTVSGDLTLTSLALGYRFNGCEGSATYAPGAALTRVPTAPTPVYSGVYESGPVGSASRTIVTFLVTSTTEAHGMVIFIDYPGCGTTPTTVTWTAAKP